MAFPVTNGVETVMPPPEGWVVNFEHPTRNENTIRQAFWVTGFELIVATAFFGQRMYTKMFLMKNFQIDDSRFCWSTSHSFARFSYRASRDSFVGTLGRRIQLVFSVGSRDNTHMYAHIPTTILSKLVLCVFYYRLSPVTAYQYAVNITAFICAGGLGAMWFSVLFACKPIAAAWDVRLAAEAICVNRPAIYIIQAALGCITDLMLLLLPIPTVIGLQLSLRHKVGLLGMFAIGSVTLVTSIVRLVLLLPGLDNTDQPWALAEGCLWVNVESNLLIMCGSLPTFRVFLNHVAPRLLGDKSKKDSSAQAGSGKSYGLRTFGGGGGGGGPLRRKFDTLLELEHDEHFNDSDLRPDESGRTDVTIYGGQADGISVNSQVKKDTDSEEAILQTRTTIVAFSKR
ncbi:hypothetical protein AAE478_004816 [Parahypoxylon ruwenzoriense]